VAFRATERIVQPINDDGGGVLLYPKGAMVSDEDAELYPDKVEAVEDAEVESVEQESGEADGFESMTRDQLVAYFNEQRPDTPLPKNARRADALAAVRSL
jgi:hypothetical protein